MSRTGASPSGASIRKICLRSSASYPGAVRARASSDCRVSSSASARLTRSSPFSSRSSKACACSPAASSARWRCTAAITWSRTSPSGLMASGMCSFTRIRTMWLVPRSIGSLTDPCARTRSENAALTTSGLAATPSMAPWRPNGPACCTSRPSSSAAASSVVGSS